MWLPEAGNRCRARGGEAVAPGFVRNAKENRKIMTVSVV